MGVTVITGHRLEALFDALRADLEREPTDPMENETVLVPGLGVARWLELRLAEQRGVAAGVEMPFLGAWLPGLAREQGADDDLFGREVLTWRIWRLLEERRHETEDRRRFGAASDYIQDDPDGRKRLQLCRRLSACFDDYQLYRDELLGGFAAGDEQASLSPHAPWQGRLWRALLDDAHDATAAHRLAALRDRLADDAWCSEQLPERLHVFGATTIPPAFLDVLFSIGRHADVRLYLPQPTPHYVGDLRARRERAGDHALLARLGAESRELQGLLVDLEERAADDALVEHRSLDDLFDATAQPPATLLECLQRDVVDAYDRGADDAEPFALRRDDDSVRVHDCHSPQRELEVVRDQIFRAFEQDPTLAPRDVMVLVPDIDRYAPYAHAVFHPFEGYLPLHIADRNPARELPVCRAALSVLALAQTRLTLTDVVHLLEDRAIQRRFQIQPSQVAVVRHLCRAAGVRWGLDGDSREEQFDVPAFDDNSWRQGLDRLVLGNLTGPADELVCGYAPVGDTTEARAELLESFLGFAHALFEQVDAMRTPQPLDGWARRVDALVDALFDARDSHEEEAVRQLRRAAGSLRDQARAARHDAPVSPAVLQSWLEDALGRGAKAGGQPGAGDRGFLGGAITFAAMLPMRAVPVRALYVCGLDDTSFPRRDAPSPFDLMAAQPRPGDRSRRLDDRQLFLDLLLATRDRLHLTFVGRSARDNAEAAPSVVVSELLEHVDRTCTAPRPKPSELLLVQHPLQPWSPRYRGGDPRLFTYAAQPAIAAEAGAPSPFCPPGEELVADPATDDGGGPIQVDDLLQFWQHPCRTFLQRSLRVRLRSEDERDDALEPFAVDGLTRYHIQNEAVRRAQRGAPERDDPLAWTRAGGVLPAGAQGDAAFQALRADASALIDEARAYAGTSVRRADVAVGDDRVTGTLDGLGDDARTVMRVSSLKPKDRLAAWIQHLVMVLAEDQREHDDPPWPRRTRLLSRDAEHAFVEVDPQQAQLYLSQLIARYREGLTQPLPFFELASFAVGDGLRKETEAEALLKRARGKYEPKRDGERYGADLLDRDVALCMRDRDPIAEGERGAFFELAAEVWPPALEHLEEVRG